MTPEQKAEHDRMFADIQAKAEGKLACECGNKDWRMFLYVMNMMAGCKRCGRAYMLVGDKWELKSGPAPTPPQD